MSRARYGRGRHQEQAPQLRDLVIHVPAIKVPNTNTIAATVMSLTIIVDDFANYQDSPTKSSANTHIKIIVTAAAATTNSAN
jgi:hypothetical protein